MSFQYVFFILKTTIAFIRSMIYDTLSPTLQKKSQAGYRAEDYDDQCNYPGKSQNMHLHPTTASRGSQ